MRRIGDTPHKDQVYRHRPGAYAILPLAERFLLTAQFEDGWDYQLPGGGIDPGESPIRALHREVTEETGWRISSPRRIGAFRRFAFMPEYDVWAEKICHVYVARPVYQLSEPLEPLHANVVLTGEEAVDCLGNDGDRMFMQRFLEQHRPRIPTARPRHHQETLPSLRTG